MPKRSCDDSQRSVTTCASWRRRFRRFRAIRLCCYAGRTRIFDCARSRRFRRKPKREAAPSNLSITGRYLLQPEIFEILATQEKGAGGEIQITDAMIKLAKTQPFYGLKFEGRSFDCGSKIGFLSANVAYALERPDLAPAFRAEIKKLLG